jgi:hypothetical protein
MSFVYGGGSQFLLQYEFPVLARSYMFRYSSYGPICSIIFCSISLCDAWKIRDVNYDSKSAKTPQDPQLEKCPLVKSQHRSWTSKPSLLPGSTVHPSVQARPSKLASPIHDSPGLGYRANRRRGRPRSAAASYLPNLVRWKGND